MANKLLEKLTLDDVTYDIPILGVKGQQETAYRDGNVNLSIDNLAFLGTNPTGGLANDTKAKWKELGTGYAVITQNNMVNGQPAQYGILINYSYGTDMLAQHFLNTSNGAIYRRGNNAAATTAMPAFVKADTDTTYTAGTNLTLSNGAFAVKASPAFTGTPTAPTNTTYTTSNTQIATTKFVQEAIKRRLGTLHGEGQTLSVTSSGTAYKYITGKAVFTAPSAGVAIATASASFPANGTGVRKLIMRKGTTILHYGVLTNNAGTAFSVPLSYTVTTSVTKDQKIDAGVLQNSGSTLSVPVFLQVYFIAN